jgi:pantothenate synthetase (EC 6.3.2.1)
MEEIPRSHPRYWSLVTRQKLVDAMKEGIVVPQGLISHGRVKHLTIYWGERTLDFAA